VVSYVVYSSVNLGMPLAWTKFWNSAWFFGATKSHGFACGSWKNAENVWKFEAKI